MRTLLIVIVGLVVVLIPAGAWAAWGTEMWGEMVWGEGNLPLPSLSVWGQIALAVLLLALPGRLLLKRRRASRP
jgi:hypothetical protein